MSMMIAMIGSSCHKGPVHQPDWPAPLSLVKLKDINIRALPSPYYHFECNDTGNIPSQASRGD